MNYNIENIPSFRRELKKLAKKYRNLKADYQKLLETLSTSENPKKLGVSLGKNCYKIRIQNSDNSKGKSGGYRVIYYLIEDDKLITLLSIYSKSDIENLSEEQIDQKVIENLNS
jgi:mRNA-degrading endonuclease RelE of RelBE toxin-antitoxin system